MNSSGALKPDGSQNRRSDLRKIATLSLLGLVLMVSLFELGRWISF